MRTDQNVTSRQECPTCGKTIAFETRRWDRSPVIVYCSRCGMDVEIEPRWAHRDMPVEESDGQR